MRPWFETVSDLGQGRDIVRGRRYGVIEARDGQFHRLLLRPFPAVVSAPGILLLGNWQHRHMPSDRCRLYYSQPWRFPNYLAVTYFVSGRRTSLATIVRTLETLDEIAEIKQADALLCDVANWRISPRILARFGWEPHCPSRWHRNYIKRFYGVYPKTRRASLPAGLQLGAV